MSLPEKFFFFFSFLFFLPSFSSLTFDSPTLKKKKKKKKKIRQWEMAPFPKEMITHIRLNLSLVPESEDLKGLI